MRLLAATILVLAVAGCSDAPSPRQQMAQANALQRHYYSDIDSPAFAILAGKVDLHQTYHPSENPCTAIERDRVPTAEESVALKRWAALLEAYLAKLEAVLVTTPSGSLAVKQRVDQFYAVMDNGLRGQAVLISNLAEGRLSYCQFATQDKDLTEGVLQEASLLRAEVHREMRAEYSLDRVWTTPSANSELNNVKLK